jgi:hypothetical protein
MRDKITVPGGTTIYVLCDGCAEPFPLTVPKYHSNECYLEQKRRPIPTQVCVICGGPITGRPSSRATDGQRFYCSPACYRKRPPLPAPVLFYRHVDLNSDAPCHRWTGACPPPGGHGRFGVGHKAHLAHRAAFVLWHGREPAPVLHHRCGNPWCVNPAHLEELPDRATHGRIHNPPTTR